MAMGRLRPLCRDLVKTAGYPELTPVGIVKRAGCPDQMTVAGTLRTITDIAEGCRIRPPSTIVMGVVVNVLLTNEDLAGLMEEGEEDAKDVAVGAAKGRVHKRLGRGMLNGQPLVD
jgi:siroheme synthase